MALFESAPEEVSVSGKGVSRHVRSSAKFRDPLEFPLFPEVPGASVPSDHLARQIIAILSEMDLSFLTRMYAHRGGVPYHPINLLAVVLYGMTRGHRLGRELEEECRFDDRYRFLMGGHTPDDRTFDRFIERVGPHLESVMAQVLVKAKKLGMSKGNEVAIDGCKVPGSSSWWKSHKDSCEVPSDPDARLMNSHGRRLVGYNALLAVDTGDGLIVGAQLVNDQNDMHCAPVILESVRSQLGELPCVALGDSGFESPAGIAGLEDMGVDTVFAYRNSLPECLDLNGEGQLVCPARKVLVKLGSQRKTSDGRLYDAYRPEGGCQGCPFKTSCEFFTKELQVPRGTDPGARYRNRARFHSAAYAGAMNRRRCAETPFAFLRRHDMFDRFRGRSLNKARAEYFLWVVSYNLRKILRNSGALLDAVLSSLKWIFALEQPAQTTIHAHLVLFGIRTD